MSWIKNKFNKYFNMDINEEYEDEQEEVRHQQQSSNGTKPKLVHEQQLAKNQAFRFPLIEDDFFEEPKKEAPSKKVDYFEEDAPLKLPNHLQKPISNAVYDGEVSGIRDLLERRRKGRGHSNVIRSSDDISRKVVVSKEEREILTSNPMREERKINKEFVNPLENRKRFVPTDVPSPVHGFLKPTPIEKLMEKHEEKTELTTTQPIVKKPVKIVQQPVAAPVEEIMTENKPVVTDVLSAPIEEEQVVIATEEMEQPEAIQQVAEEIVEQQEMLEVPQVTTISKNPIEFEAEVEIPEKELQVTPPIYEQEPAPPVLVETDNGAGNPKVEEPQQSATDTLNDMQVKHVTIANSTIHIGQLNVEQMPQTDSTTVMEQPPSVLPQREITGSRVPFNVVMLKSDKQKLLTKQFVQEQRPKQHEINSAMEETATVEANLQVSIDESSNMEPQSQEAVLNENEQTSPTIVERTEQQPEIQEEKGQLQQLQEEPEVTNEQQLVDEAIVLNHVEQIAAQEHPFQSNPSAVIEQISVQMVTETMQELDPVRGAVQTLEREELIAEVDQVEELQEELQQENSAEPLMDVLPIGLDNPVVEPLAVDLQQAIIEVPVEEVQPEKKRIPYVKPPLEYLVPPEEMIEDRDWMDEQGDNLVESLSHFQIQAQIESIIQGPAVTQFEITVGHGTKVSKVRNLADDIKLALAAKDIRIDAPIPGKRSIGIEIPNRISRSVRLSEVTDSESFRNSDSPLEAALGLDLTGRPVTIDLRKMPHGLIAGATGSGKSVCINSILVSLLYKSDPNELKLLLIDPKMVELAPFNHIPHLVSPVITDVKAATAALKWAVEEMERRYQLFMHSGARKIESYNKMCDEKGMYAQKLPYLLIVIDELADLMMMSPQDVEDSIVRITQKARAAGIHLIVATQRPSVDVITGLIKSNIPTRIAFSVSSQIDSRTILDSQGAERLLGRGDMLYLGNGMSAPTRIQGTFVTDDEIEEIIEFVREQGEPDYLFKQEELLKRTEAVEEQDELFEEVCRFVYEQGSASTSLLQRRYHIGYNRAARLIDMLERQGYVSEPKGSKPRDVFITEENLADQFGD